MASLAQAVSSVRISLCWPPKDFASRKQEVEVEQEEGGGAVILTDPLASRGHTASHTQKGPMLNLMFCGYHLETLNNFLTRGPTFSGENRWKK